MFWFSVRSIDDDAIDRQVERGDLLARQVHVDLAAQAAVDGDCGHAGHALEARREDVLRELAQLTRSNVALSTREAHDRHARSSRTSEDDRRVGVLGQAAAHAIDAGADVVQRLVEVRAPGEVQLDVGCCPRATLEFICSRPATALTAARAGG